MLQLVCQPELDSQYILQDNFICSRPILIFIIIIIRIIIGVIIIIMIRIIITIIIIIMIIIIVHRCGTGCSMRVCHAAGPGSIDARDKFAG